MLNRAWIADIADAATTIGSWLRAFWVRDIWPLLMTAWILFVLAAPLILVILVLWYLDSTGWQAGNGPRTRCFWRPASCSTLGEKGPTCCSCWAPRSSTMHAA